MVRKTSDHPAVRELEAYGQGRLAAGALPALEEHLAGCQRCCEVLEQTPDDGFLGQLRAADLGATTSAVPTAVQIGEPDGVPPELADHPRYHVLGLLGQGGMGAVYRAEQRRLGRLVALKVIRPGLTRQSSFVQRFRQEARAAGQLDHPNIVRAHDADEAAGLHFLIMEYVEGTTLAELVRVRGPLPPTEAAAYVRQAALGLQHAHDRGMVHRDIKPQNLMLAAGDVVKVLDFGLARLPDGADGPAGAAPDGPLTGAGAVMGTADYIAPEQAADPRRADIRADIYALGCTLFYLLTGRPPFPDGTVSEKLARHAGTSLPAVRALRPEVPPGLATVLARMTARDPEDRAATPAEVAGALEPCAAPFLAVRPKGGGRWVKRRLTVAALAVLVAALLVGLMALRPGTKPAPVAPPDPGTDPREVAARAEGKAVTPSPAPPEVPAAEMNEEEAVEAVQRLGGQVVRDGAPGKPVFSVRLANTRTCDDDLRLLAAFPKLCDLDLSRTPITDAGLKHLTALTGLRWLTLSGIKVTDAGLKHVGVLTQLQTLDLSYTAVGDDGLKHLGGLTRLTALVLHGTKVTDAATADIGRFEHLTLLNLDHTAVTDAGLANLAGLSDLATLVLSLAAGVGDEGMKCVARFNNLRSLDLYGTRVTDTGLRELSGLHRLETLQVSGPRISDAGLAALAEMTELRVVGLSQTDVSDEGLRELARHRCLETLNLQGVRRLTDDGLRELATLPRLSNLVLARTHVTDAGLAHLAGLPQLKFLSLADAVEVTDAGLRQLPRYPQLTFVGLTGTAKVTDAGVTQLRQTLPGLKIQR